MFSPTRTRSGRVYGIKTSYPGKKLSKRAATRIATAYRKHLNRKRFRAALHLLRRARTATGVSAARSAVVSNPYTAAAAIGVAAGYGGYKMFKYLKRKRNERLARKGQSSKLFRQGIREINSLNRYERTGVELNQRAHRTDFNPYYLALSNSSVIPPADIANNQSYNNLRTLSLGNGVSIRQIIMNDLFQHIVEGTADGNRKGCAIDIASMLLQFKFINRNKYPVLIRCCLLESLQNDDVAQIKPNEQNHIIGDMFLHPDDPCTCLDISDAYWADLSTPRSKIINAKFNPRKWRVRKNVVKKIDPCLMQLVYDSINGNTGYDIGGAISMGNSLTDVNVTTNNAYQHISSVRLYSGPMSVRWMKTDTADYNYTKPALFLVCYAVAYCDDFSVSSTLLENLNVDYHYEWDVKFKNLVN